MGRYSFGSLRLKWLLLCVSYVCAEVAESPKACHMNLTSVEQGTEIGSRVIINGNSFYPGDYVKLNETHYRVCICKIHKCLRRCCPLGHSFVGKACTPTDTSFDIPVYDSDNVPAIDFTWRNFKIMYGNTCNNTQYRLDPQVSPEDQFFLLRTGNLSVPEEKRQYDVSQFCLETFVRNTSQSVDAFICFPPKLSSDPGLVFTVYPVGILISIPFLIITFLVYALLPEQRNLHGKCLMCHVASLLTAYIFLATVQLGNSTLSSSFCIACAFLIQFSFLSTFFWLNVMSFDIWWVFSGFRGFRGSKREAEHKKFLLYSCYAWGCPLFMLIVSLIMDLNPNIPSHVLKPNFGVKKCFFETKEATLAYFYGPIALLLLSNLVLFILTAVKIFAVKRETKVLHNEESRRHDDNNENNKQRFLLYLKLFLVMGINWVTEIISWAVEGPTWLWYLTDVGNTLQGIFIFIIFVCKPRIKRLFLLKFFPHLVPESVTHSSVKTTTSAVMSRNSSVYSKTSDNMKMNAIAERNSTLETIKDN